MARGKLRWPRRAVKSTGDLFGSEPDPASRRASPGTPLADRMRPQTLDEMVGQEHLVGPGRVLREAIERGELHSMILWGPPGSGKTTLASLMAHVAGARFVAFSAVLSGVKEIRQVIAEADVERTRSGRRTILFVDEIHRFNRAQQDAFLPHVEKGTVVLVGATTENPSFEVNGALLSRCRVYVLHGLAEDDLLGIMRRALTDRERGLAALRPEADDDALRLIARLANGDARAALNMLALAAKDAYDFLGSPEGELALAQATLYLALAPKSNAVYTAYNEAKADVEERPTEPVPLHIRNAPTGLMKGLGYGRGYQYAHDAEDARVDQEHLPEALRDRQYYQPTERGLEAELGRRLAEWRRWRAEQRNRSS